MPEPTQFTSQWMGLSRAYFGDQTLWEMSLPGSHDTLTYDLGGTVSRSEKGSWLFRLLEALAPHSVEHEIEDFLIGQAKTQTESLTRQLDAGLRFLDLRVSWEGPGDLDWYGVHFVITRQRFTSYLTELRAWLEAHPTEMVVAWISYHGSTCQKDQYPGATPAAQAALGANIAAQLGHLLVDPATDGEPWSTPYDHYQALGKQLVLYISDSEHFAVPGALDACIDASGRGGIDNQTGADVMQAARGFEWELGLFEQGTELYQEHKANGTLMLRSGATSGTEQLIKNQALLRFLSPELLKLLGLHPCQDCRDLFDFPPETQNLLQCPGDLRALGRMTNFYLQRSMNHALDQIAAGHPGYRMPGAMYLDGVLADGTYDTGISDASPTSRYAYVGTMLKSATAHLSCNHSGSGYPLTCHQVDEAIAALLAAAPYDDFSAPEYGRQEDWPPIGR